MPYVWVNPGAHDLLVQVHDLIEDHPERHDQSQWVSNIFGSAGGDVADLAKFADADIPSSPLDESNPVDGTMACVAVWAAILGSEPGGRIFAGGEFYLKGQYPAEADGQEVGDYARNLLELSDAQAHYLFAGRRSRDEVLTALEQLIEDPSAEIWREPAVTYTVTVTDENGIVVYDSEVELQDSETEYYKIERALSDARTAH